MPLRPEAKAILKDRGSAACGVRVGDADGVGVAGGWAAVARRVGVVLGLSRVAAGGETASAPQAVAHRTGRQTRRRGRKDPPLGNRSVAREVRGRQVCATSVRSWVLKLPWAAEAGRPSACHVSNDAATPVTTQVGGRGWIGRPDQRLLQREITPQCTARGSSSAHVEPPLVVTTRAMSSPARATAQP